MYILHSKNMVFWTFFKTTRSSICFLPIQWMMPCHPYFLGVFYGSKWIFSQHNHDPRTYFHEIPGWNGKNGRKTKGFCHVGWPMYSICWPKVNKCWLFCELDTKKFKNIPELFPDEKSSLEMILWIFEVW